MRHFGTQTNRTLGLLITLAVVLSSIAPPPGLSRTPAPAAAADSESPQAAGESQPAVAADQAQAGFLYVVNESTAGNQVYGFAVNEANGALTPLGGFPVPTGGNAENFGSGSNQGSYAENLTIDRVNNRLYVINNGSRTISAYSINPTTGALTPLPFSPISLGAGTWTTIAVHPSGSPLVVGDSQFTPSFGRVRSYAITATTATEAAGSPYSFAFVGPYSSVFSRDGNFYYAGGAHGVGYFVGFAVNPATGVLTQLPGSQAGVYETGNGVGESAALATDTLGRLFMGGQGG